MDGGQHRGHPRVIHPPLNANRPLSDSRQHLFGVNGRARHIRQPEPVQPGHRQEGRRRHAIGQLLHPGLHIAPELHQLQIGPAMRQLRPPPQAGRANHRTLRQIHQPRHTGADKGIAHIFAWQIAIQHQPLGLQRWHILHRMHGDIDAARQKRLFNLAGEQALTANLFQGAVQNLVARHLDDDDFKGLERQGKGHRKARARLMRLRQSQRRAACADVQGAVG